LQQRVRWTSFNRRKRTSFQPALTSPLQRPGADRELVARVGGTEVAGDFVDASRISELTSRLLGAAEQAG
jgi:hypothetical protein